LEPRRVHVDAPARVEAGDVLGAIVGERAAKPEQRDRVSGRELIRESAEAVEAHALPAGRRAVVAHGLQPARVDLAPDALEQAQHLVAPHGIAAAVAEAADDPEFTVLS